MSGVPKIGDNRRVFYPSRYQTRKTLQQDIEVPEGHVAFVRIHYGIDGMGIEYWEEGSSLPRCRVVDPKPRVFT